MERLPDLAEVTKAVAEATPGPLEMARAFGEGAIEGDPEGKWEVRAVDRDGAPDPKKAHLLREMYQDANRAEMKLNALVSRGKPQVRMNEDEFLRRVAGMTHGERREFERKLEADDVRIVKRFHT